MDNNNPVPPQPIAPVQITSPVDTLNPTGGQSSKKIILFLVVGIFILALVIGGVYYYLSSIQPAQNVVTQPSAAQPVAVSQPTPIKEVDPIDADLNALKIDSIDNSLAEVDQQLKSF